MKMFSLLALIDDVAATMDDVAVMTKIAMKKTSALMSDDLAVNAGVIDGVHADRELPMVWAIFLGSLLNKVYCILGVLGLIYAYPPLIKIILFVGGLYLAYEGAHKILEKVQELRNKQANDSDSNQPNLAPVTKEMEQEKIKGAIKTDLILSIEIIVIAKNALKGPMQNQILSLILVGIGASIIIYGLVAFLVKIDDFGLWLIRKGKKNLGLSLVRFMPYMMKGLGILGTIAMLLVGGGIVSHTFHLPYYLPEILQNLILGLFAGILTLPLVHFVGKFFVKQST